MQKIEKIFVDNLGFSQKKASVYIAILRAGEISASDLAKKIGMKRTSVYNILPELISQGFVSKTTKKGKEYFFIEDPKNLAKDINERAESINNIIPKLEAIQKILPYHPKIKVYEGFGGMKDIYRDVISSIKTGDEILSIIGSQDISRFVPEEIMKFYIKEREEKKVVNKIITYKSNMADEWALNAKKDLREIKIINGQMSSKVDMKIYSNKLSILAYDEGCMGIIIESDSISSIQKEMFYLLWNNI